MNTSNCSISFQVKHPMDKLDDVGKVLNILPFRAWNVGDVRKTPKGKALDGYYQYSYSCIRIQSIDNADASALIERFLEKVEESREYWNSLFLSGGEFKLIVFNQEDKLSDEFNWQLLSRLSNLRISLGLDVGRGSPGSEH